jgi:undecaprenyl phosphate N,N'-diacetylbacillosamine 1-phosphate transferase
MSIVGPRPLLVEYLPLYSVEQKQRHLIKPGLTGWAQVNGRNVTTWEQRLINYIYYVINMSFTMDIKIIIQTFKKVITRKNISSDGQATMSKFNGN